MGRIGASVLALFPSWRAPLPRLLGKLTLPRIFALEDEWRAVCWGAPIVRLKFDATRSLEHWEVWKRDRSCFLVTGNGWKRIRWVAKYLQRIIPSFSEENCLFGMKTTAPFFIYKFPINCVTRTNHLFYGRYITMVRQDIRGSLIVNFVQWMHLWRHALLLSLILCNG